MINLSNMTEKYFKLFGKSPEFSDDATMSKEKIADCIGYCIDHKITIEELNSASKAKNHCNVWDYIMDEDLDEPGARKYGNLEKK